MGTFTPFWILAIILALIVAAVNFAIGATRRSDQLVFAVRVAAGLASVGAVAFIIIGKLADIFPVLIQLPVKIAIVGLFVFAVLFIPSVVEKNREQASSEPTLAQRAARPTNATVRLRERGADEWVN